MKKIKILFASVLFCVMGYTGYTAHEYATMSDAEKMMKANIEALTQDEGGGVIRLDAGELLDVVVEHSLNGKRIVVLLMVGTIAKVKEIVMNKIFMIVMIHPDI